MKDINRTQMIYAIMVYLLVWYGGALLAIKYMGIDAVTALGIGTAGGVFLSSFKDAWQFLWRKSPGETTPNGTPPGSNP